MRCNDCQDKILSDYLDGELNDSQKNVLEIHIRKCRDCREFAQRARIDLTDIFETAGSRHPPESVWDNILSSIETAASETDPTPRPGIREWLAGLRMPAFALGTAIVVLVTASLIKPSVAPRTVSSEDFQEEVEYIAFMLGGDLLSDDPEGYGTAIEEYFL